MIRRAVTFLVLLAVVGGVILAGAVITAPEATLQGRVTPGSIGRFVVYGVAEPTPITKAPRWTALVGSPEIKNRVGQQVVAKGRLVQMTAFGRTLRFMWLSAFE